MHKAIPRLIATGVLAAGLPLGLLTTTASAATPTPADSGSAAAVATITPDGSVSFPGLNCTYGVSDSTGWGRCTGVGAHPGGTWTLHVGCNFNPVVITHQVTQGVGPVTLSQGCFAFPGVNDVWLTSP
jgi:hypothetical protein